MRALAVHSATSSNAEDQERDDMGHRRIARRRVAGEWAPDAAGLHSVSVPQWYAHARCIALPDSFDNEINAHAIRVCANCPVREECLNDALRWERGQINHAWGVRGGMTPAQRRKEWQFRRRRPDPQLDAELAVRVPRRPAPDCDDVPPSPPRAKVAVSVATRRDESLAVLWGLLADVNRQMAAESSAAVLDALGVVKCRLMARIAKALPS